MWKTEVLVNRYSATGRPRQSGRRSCRLQLGACPPPPATQGNAGVKCRPGSSASDLARFATKAEKGSHCGDAQVWHPHAGGQQGEGALRAPKRGASLLSESGPRTLAQTPSRQACGSRASGGFSFCQSSRGPTKRQPPCMRVRGGGLAFGERALPDGETEVLTPGSGARLNR